MIIRGILDKSLSKQTCIRGFARIKELARISKANPEYQRELIDKQQRVISNFLTEESYLFFPEVILSLKLKYDFTKTNSKKENPLTLIESKNTFKSNVNSLSLKVLERKNTKSFDVGGRDEVKVVELEFDEGELSNLIASNNHPFHRIDGNHRLSAAEQIEDDDRILTMDIPFCIVLFEEITSNEFNPEKEKLEKITNTDYEKFERVVFYNINSKSVALTLEQNLKGILGEEKYFSNQEVDKIFNGQDNPDGKIPDKIGSLARELGLRISPSSFSSIKHLLSNNKWALCLRILQLYNNYEVAEHDKLIDVIYDSLQEINIIYKKEALLKSNESIEILISLLYYKAFSDENTFSFFLKWVTKNHLFEAQETTAESILNIFNRICERRNLSVFVAMPYWSHPKVNEYNKLFTEILKEVQQKVQTNIMLNLIPIMRFKGRSERIDSRLLNSIRDCDIFIAELTDCNPNVLYETAYAEGCNKISILIKDERDKKNILPFDMDKRQYIPYDGTVYYSDIKTKVINQLKATLISDFYLEF